MAQSNNRRVIQFFWQALKPYRVIVFTIVFSIVTSSVLDLIAPLYYKRFFDVLTTPGSTDGLFIPLVTLLGIVFLIHLGSWAFTHWGWYGIAKLEPRVMADLEQNAFHKFQGHSYRFFTNAFTGSLVRRINRITKSFEDIFDISAGSILPLLVTIIGILVVLFGRNFWVGFAVLVWTVLFFAVNYSNALRKLPFDVARAAKDTEVGATLSDALSNSINIKLFSGTKDEDKRLRHVSNELKQMRIQGWVYNRNVATIQFGLMILIEFVVMSVAVSLWQRHLLTVGDFALFQGYLISLFSRLNSSYKLIRRMFESFAEAKETVDVLDLPYEVQDVPRAKKLAVREAKIEFKDVAFSYNQDADTALINELDMTIRSKEKIALVGPSGAGKSTIIKLLLRFFDVSHGTILIDGQSIADVTQESLRDQIALVPQDPVLFHRTLLDNIRYGRRDATDREVIEAAKRAQCHEFIQHLPNKYDTFVGERGIKLSGGERQRVAIARAILKNAPILLLDEATSSLDSESELAIQEALKELMKQKTTIAIAHRLSTIMQMDRIIVMEQGKITDTGTHEALLHRPGIYHTLWKIQAGGFAS